MQARMPAVDLLTMPLERCRDRLLALLTERAVKHGDFVLASGRRSTYYVDGKQVTLEGEGLLLTARLLLAFLDEFQVEAVGGPTIGADPIVGAVCAVSALQGKSLVGFLVRREPKDHGTGKLLEGPVPTGCRAGVLEDVVTTGSSMLRAVDAARSEAGCTVPVCVAILDREEGGAEAIRAAGCEFRPIFRRTDLGL